MVHAHPDPRSFGLDTGTLPSPAKPSQAEARAAYIESILADWPAPTPQQERTIGSMLGNGTPSISVDQYRHWEIVRHLDAETGRNGYFTAENAA